MVIQTFVAYNTCFLNDNTSGALGADTRILHLLADKLGFKFNVTITTSFDTALHMVCMNFNNTSNY